MAKEEFVKVTGNTILITGGGTGIGLALAKVFVEADNEVIICCRRTNKLKDAKLQLPKLHIFPCDIANANQRQMLFQRMMENFPKLNILINNAGIQNHLDFKMGLANLLKGEDEIETNLRAPIHLAALFIPHLMKQEPAAIINVSSGLGFVPMAIMPVYCATKAALHSFSLSLRHQLRETSIKVFEIIPPTVDTNLDRGARRQQGRTDRGITPSEVAQATLQALSADENEVAVGRAQWLRTGSRQEPEKLFQILNGA